MALLLLFLHVCYQSPCLIYETPSVYLPIFALYSILPFTIFPMSNLSAFLHLGYHEELPLIFPLWVNSCTPLLNTDGKHD